MRLLCLPLILVGLVFVTVAKAGVTPADLRCEYLQNPIGITATDPRLDWILTGSADTPRNLSQIAYHILVASSSDLLAHDKGDLWDTGEVQSDDTVGIPYAGVPLKSRQPCFWKVRVTDSLHHTSQWSPVATWEMGFLNPADWHAQWLDAPTSTSPPPGQHTLSIVHASYEAVDGTGAVDVTGTLAGRVYKNHLSVTVNNATFGTDPAYLHRKQLSVTYAIDGVQRQAVVPEFATLTLPAAKPALSYLRKDFTLGKSIAGARLYATALGVYEFHLNGRRVGDHVLAPDWTDYNKRVRYQVYDVTSMVRPGANTLAGLVGHGWYSGRIGNGGYQAWGKVPALFAQLEITYTDGTVDRIVTDSSWKVHPCPIISSDLMLGESYDARREIPGWDQPGLSLADWTPATVRTEPSRSLDAQVDQPVRETAELHPKAMTQPLPGHWTYDLGQNMVGVVRLQVSAPAGTRITLSHAEMLQPNGSIYTKNLRGAPSIDTYICKGGGVETWQPRFTFHGFRYVELTGLPQPPPDGAITGIVIGTDIPRTGNFSTSDPEINQLQSNIQWGMRGNYLAIPTDCPQRDERMGWMGDAQIFIRTATYNGDVAAFFTKWLVDVDDAQTPQGAFTDVSPSPIGKGHGNPGVPAWGDAGVICPWIIHLAYGDNRILEQHLPAMMAWVDWCKVHSTNLIRDRDRGPDYGDWLAQGETTPKDLIGTAFFAYSTSLVAQSCRAVGNTVAADKYQQLFEQIKTAFDQRYVQPDGHVQGGTQCAYCLALQFDLLPPDLRSKAAGYLSDNIASRQYHLTTGFVGVSHLLPALTSGDKLDTAYRVFLQKTFPSWLFSVEQGATTVWERWDGWTPQKGFQDPGMNSFNHYSLGSCGEWMFDTVAGIGLDPAHPGFKHIIIHPRPGGGLTHAEATYDSIHGQIASAWTLRDGTFSLHVIIPINTDAAVEFPVPAATSVSESGASAAKNPGLKSSPAPDGNARYLIGSGDYRFTCRLP